MILVCFSGKSKYFMMKNILKIFLLLFALTLLSVACNDDDIFCTDEYRQISVKVEFEDGSAPAFDYFTLRVSAGDTIRYDESMPIENTYVVLADDYQPELQGLTEEFRFIGTHQGDIIFNEEFIISADECHISKVDGPGVITVGS